MSTHSALMCASNTAPRSLPAFLSPPMVTVPFALASGQFSCPRSSCGHKRFDAHSVGVQQLQWQDFGQQRQECFRFCQGDVLQIGNNPILSRKLQILILAQPVASQSAASMIASLRMRLTLFSELFGRPLPEMSVASAQMMASFVKLLLDQAQQQAFARVLKKTRPPT